MTSINADNIPNPKVDRSQLPPGPPELPILGQTLRYIRDPIGLMQEAATYGDLATLSVRPFLMFQANHPDLIQEIFSTQHRRVGRGRLGSAIRLIFGENLITSGGATHLRNRRLMQPHFHNRRIASYGETMIRYARRHQQRWTDGMEVDMVPEMRDLTLHIVVKALFGIDLPEDVTRIGEVFDFCNLYLIRRYNQPAPLRRLAHRLPLPLTRRFRREMAYLDGIVNDLIEQCRESNEERDDLLALLVHTKDAESDRPDEAALTDLEVRNEVGALFTAGHETTTLALTWTWYLLATHPEWQACWHAELDEVLGDRAVTLSDLPNLTVTDQILTESLRLYPPFWSAGRMVFESFELAGFQLPVGAMVLAPQIVMHRNARWFEEPEAFRPDRWTPEFRQNLPTFAYYPFGGGPRRCIGDSFAWMEAQIVLATLGQSWRVRHVPRHPVELETLATLQPKHGMPIALERRHARRG